MHFCSQKSPQVGDESPTVGDLPLQEIGENLEQNRTENLSFQTEVSNQPHAISTSIATPTSSAPTRTHFRSSSSTSRRLLHRCPFGNCCNKNRSSTAAGLSGHFGRASHRTAGNSVSMTHTNIPFDNQDGTQTWPLRNTIGCPNKTTSFYQGYHNLHNLHHHSHNLHHNNYNNERWQQLYNPNNRSSCEFNITCNNQYPEITTAVLTHTIPREVLVRGIPNTTTKEIQQLDKLQHQQQQQQQDLRVQPHDRKRAINYMMSHLQVRCSNDDSAALVAVRERIERLENQVYHSVKTKEEYVHHLASKLGAIMDTLYTGNTSRLQHPQSSIHPSVQSPIHPSVHTQSACV